MENIGEVLVLFGLVVRSKVYEADLIEPLSR